MANIIDGTSAEIRGEWAHIGLAEAFEPGQSHYPGC